MRYLLMVLGAIGLTIGVIVFVNAHNPEHNIRAAVLVVLGGIFLATGMATIDIVEAIKGRRS